MLIEIHELQITCLESYKLNLYPQILFGVRVQLNFYDKNNSSLLSGFQT